MDIIEGEANEANFRSDRPPPSDSEALSVINNPSLNTFQVLASLDPTLDNRFIVLHGMGACTAFLCIAEILKLACCQNSGFNIAASTDTLPLSIAPTLKQKTVPHQPYVDMLPWSSVRDRMLNSPSAINESEFVHDMASGDLKVWGSVAWDPMGWEIGPDFAQKWWFLMDDEALKSTNFWRSQRGEKALILPRP